MNIADEFAKMGHETKLVLLEGNTEIKQSDYEYYGVEKDFEIFTKEADYIDFPNI